MRKYNVIDLFCGCGGFSKGFEQAGFNVRYGVDLWKDATITYHQNFPDATCGAYCKAPPSASPRFPSGTSFQFFQVPPWRIASSSFHHL